MMRRVVALVAALTMVGLAGCTAASTPDTGPPPSPFGPCPAATSPPAVPASSGDLVPDLTLACATGGEPVSLRRLGRPAVINLWASYCAPCREELPELQRFADALGDQVVVLGVITADDATRAAYAGEDFGVRFPSVLDPGQSVLNALGRRGIPLTLFVAADGTLRHVDATGQLTEASARSLAQTHLGLAT